METETKAQSPGRPSGAGEEGESMEWSGRVAEVVFVAGGKDNNRRCCERLSIKMVKNLM